MGEFIRHIACPSCGSSDANAEYADGSTYCFACTKSKGPTDGQAGNRPARKQATMASSDLMTDGKYGALSSRRLSEETCRKFAYQFGSTSDGTPCHIANYYSPDGGTVVAQKVRTAADKCAFTAGNIKAAGLYGQHLWPAGGKRVVVTEGEIDALTVAEALGLKWPVVSVKRGAASARKDMAEQIEWLESFDEVVLAFDMDEDGRSAVEECAQLLSPGKAKIMTLPLKDASDMHVAGRTSEIVRAVWDAKSYRPDGIRTFADVAEEAKKPIEIGLPWFNARLTELTYGRRLGEVVTIGAGTGIGKTDYIMQQVAYDVTTLKEPVGLFFFEQQNFETAKRLAGKYAKKPFHIPGAGWTQKQLAKAVDEIAATDRVFLYNHFGQTDWEIVKSRMRFLAVNHGVRLFYIDNLTALADPSNERESLELMMAECAGLAQELKVWVMLVSHLATPTGTPHEEGGKVLLQHFKGARAIGFWTFFAFGLERNRLAEDKLERRLMRLVCLKDRYTGRSDGEVITFLYDPETCYLNEYSGEPPPPDDIPETAGDTTNEPNQEVPSDAPF